MSTKFEFNPATLLLDENVDVRRRLVDLHNWQDDVIDQDSQLAKRLHQFEEEKLQAFDRRQVRLIEQKQNLIGILRRRHQILIAKVPFEVDASVISRIGYDGLFNHFAIQYAGLSKAERMLWLNNLHFLITPDIQELNRKLIFILRRTAIGEQRNLLIGGHSGSGKTRFMEWFSMHFMPVIETSHNYVPVILVEAIKDDKTTKSLLQSMVLACGTNYYEDDTVTHLFNKIGSIFQICGVQIAMVDELNHLTDLTQRRRLLEISNRTLSTSIVGAAVDPLQFRDGSPEIQGRFIDYYLIHPYTGTRLLELLAVIELLLPFSTRSYLADPTRNILEGKKQTTIDWSAKFIADKTRGSFRYIMRLIRDAAETAIEQNLPNISYDLLKDTWNNIQSSDPDKGEYV